MLRMSTETINANVKQQTHKICELAVKQHGLALESVKQQTGYICELAVKQHGLALVNTNITWADVKGSKQVVEEPVPTIWDTAKDTVLDIVREVNVLLKTTVIKESETPNWEEVKDMFDTEQTSAISRLEKQIDELTKKIYKLEHNPSVLALNDDDFPSVPNHPTMTPSAPTLVEE